MTFKIQLVAALTAALITGPACATEIHWESSLDRENPLVGKIYSVRDQSFISEQDLLERSRAADYFLIGETHDNPDHHTIEQLLLEGRLTGGASPAVSFEMLDDTHSDKIPKLDKNDALVDMNEKLAWGENRWPWDTYGPLFHTVVSNGATLVEGNISKDIQMRIYREGEAALAGDRFDSLPAMTSAQRDRLMDNVYDSHCGKMPREKLGGMLTIQMAKDASMAQSMVTNRTSDGAILVAGGYHVRKDLSIPSHLRAKDPDGHIASLLITQVKQGASKLGDYSEEQTTADYLWFTPRFSDRNYCDDIK